IAAPSTVTSNTPITLGRITFDSPYGYTLAGTGPLAIEVVSGSATISVLQGTHQIAMPVTINDPTVASVGGGAALVISGPLTLANGSTFTTTGAGTVAITSPVTSSPGAKFQVSGGDFIAASDLNGAIAQIDAGSAWFDANQHL